MLLGRALWWSSKLDDNSRYIEQNTDPKYCYQGKFKHPVLAFELNTLSYLKVTSSLWHTTPCFGQHFPSPFIDATHLRYREIHSLFCSKILTAGVLSVIWFITPASHNVTNTWPPDPEVLVAFQTVCSVSDALWETGMKLRCFCQPSFIWHSFYVKTHYSVLDCTTTITGLALVSLAEPH